MSWNTQLKENERLHIHKIYLKDLLRNINIVH